MPLSAEKPSDLVWLEDEYRHQETWRTPLEGGPPTNENVGSYRGELTLMERVQVELICRSLIDRFGYRVTSEVEPHKTTIFFERAKEVLRLARNRTSN